MISESDLAYIEHGSIEKTAASGTLVGALGGAGLGALLQYLRPKDKDQNSLKEYLLSALTGAALGGLGGFAYDNLKSNQFNVSGKQRNSSAPTKKYVAIPDNHALTADSKLYPLDSKHAKDYKKLLDDNKAKGLVAETVEDLYKRGVILADNGRVAERTPFIMFPELYDQLYSNDSAMFTESNGKNLRIASEHLAPVIRVGNDIYPMWFSEDTHELVPAMKDGPLFRGNRGFWSSLLLSGASTAGDAVDALIP